MLTVAALAKVALFQGLSEAELTELAAIAQARDVIAGDSIFTEGSPASSFFVIQLGSVEILKQGASGDVQKIVTLGTGSHFGEMAFLDDAPRAASAVARESSRLIEFPFHELEALFERKREIGYPLYRTLARSLARRIRQTTLDLTHLKELKLRHV
jgi:CRP/FNR family cyclic AMP-dependent transcriptional regulator